MFTKRIYDSGQSAQEGYSYMYIPDTLESQQSDCEQFKPRRIDLEGRHYELQA